MDVASQVCLLTVNYYMCLSFLCVCSSQIPFSRFLLSVKGRVQEKDGECVEPEKVVGLSITLADRIDGPFSLEIDSIRVKKTLDMSYDGKASHTGIYETYKFPRTNYDCP